MLIRITIAVLTGMLAMAQASAQNPAVIVVTSPGAEAYEQMLAGIREKFPEVFVLDARNEEQLREQIGRQRPALAVAVGADASLALERAASGKLPLLSSGVFECDMEHSAGAPSAFRSTVTVDLPAAVLMSELRRLFPGKSRIGLIQGPMQNDAYGKAFALAARQAGLTAEVVRCDDPRDLLEVFLKLKPRADLVWCPANPRLYNSATLKPLLMASITNRLPIIGFSEQFVQAGALFGGSADFVDVGRQTAE